MDHCILAFNSIYGQAAKKDWNIIWQHKRILLLLAVTGVAGYNTIIYFALQYTTSINASVVNSTTPLFIAILAIFILREKLLAHQAAGILLSVFGILYIISKGSIEMFLSWKINAGDLYVLAAVIMWALYSVIGKNIQTYCLCYLLFMHHHFSAFYYWRP